MVKRQIVKNISFSFCANLLSFLVSIFMVMFVPKFLSIDEYGKWQLFLFYMTYLGVFTFGWRDGIYLRYAGDKLENLNKSCFSGQIYSYVLLMIMVSLFMTLLNVNFIRDPVKKEILLGVAVILPLYNFEGLCSSILQMTNCIKKYASLIAVERGTLLLLILVFLFLGARDYESMYSSNLIALAIASTFGVFACHVLFTTHLPTSKQVTMEALENIKVGIQLLTANIVGFFIIGIVRFGISAEWDVSTFGKVSLVLSLSNFLMVFIDSVSVVFFPLLKHIDLKKLGAVYIKGRLFLSVIVLGILLFYYPAKLILLFWLPQYAESFAYMAILFPVCVYESRFSLLINTYLKAIRREGLILKINIISIVVSCLFTMMTVYVMHNIRLAIISVIFLYAFRCELAENYLMGILKINILRDLISDNLLVLIFILTGFFINSWGCTVVYGCVYFIYLLFKKKHIIKLIREIRLKE